MICIVDDNNKITNIVDSSYSIAENERPYYPWNRLWDTYTDVEPTAYKLERLRKEALDYQGGIYNKEKYAIAWVDRNYKGKSGIKIGFDTDLEQNSQTDWNSVRRVLDDMISLGMFEEGEEPNIPYRYWINDTEKEYAPVTLTELKQAGFISSQQQNAAFAKFEPILKEIRETQDIEVLKKYLPVSE